MKDGRNTSRKNIKQNDQQIYKWNEPNMFWTVKKDIGKFAQFKSTR